MSSSCHFSSFPFRARRISHLDHVNIKDSDKLRELLGKYGDNYPTPEFVEFTAKLNKINKRNKKQIRVFILTDKALYNVKPNSINILQRRIDIKDIASVTSSLTSLELTIHVPAQYDYRYEATDRSQKTEIIRMVSAASHRVGNVHLNIHKIHQSSTSEYTLYRNEAQLLSREQRHNRKRALMCREVDINATQRIQNLPGQLHDMLLSYGWVRDEGVFEMNLYIPSSIYPLVFKYFHIPFKFENYTIIAQMSRNNGYFPGQILKIEQNNSYKRGSQCYVVRVVKKRAYHKLGILENKRLLQEIGYNHFILSLCYAFQTKHKLFTIVEYFDGVTLHTLVKKHGNFDEALSKIIVAQICLAIGHLHRFNVFNIDLQPSKIIINECGFIKVTDILPINCNERLTDSIKSVIYSIEDISYWAPERLIYKHEITASVDWWSVGIILYELRTGNKPFYSTEVNVLKNKILNGLFVYPKTVRNRSDGFKDLMMRLLHKKASVRMGAGDSDIKPIMRHEYFNNIHWFNLKKKEIIFDECNVILRSFETQRLDGNIVAQDMRCLLENDQFDFCKNDDAFDAFTSFP